MRIRGSTQVLTDGRKQAAMSFMSYKDVIEAGDTVMMYQSPKAIKPITVVPGEVLNNKYGHFLHDAMVSIDRCQPCHAQLSAGSPRPFWVLNVVGQPLASH